MSGRGNFKIPEAGEIVIINYDILPDPEEIEKMDLKGTILICDEAHKVKNYKAKRSQKVTKLSEKCDRMWFLTGTPLMTRPFDLYGLLSAGEMAKEVFGGFNGFLREFQGYKTRFGYEFGMPLDSAAEKLRRVSMRRMKDDVLKDLPPKTFQEIVINGLSKSLSKKMDKFLNKYKEILDDEVVPGAGLPGFEEFSEIRAALAKARIPAAIEIVESFEDSDTPLIVFSAHREPVLKIGEREGWGTIVGGMDNADKHEVVKDFQEGKLKGVALTIGAGSEGITLTRASNMLFVDLDWSPLANAQAEDRIRRIGQKSSSLLYQTMVTSHPLDLHVQSLLAQKTQLIRKAIDNTIDFKAPKQLDNNQPDIIEETEDELSERIENAIREEQEKAAKAKVHGILGREMARAGDDPMPELTDNRKKLIRKALSHMAGQCDGAKERDGIGFNKPDAAIGHWLVATGLHANDDDTFRVAERILSRYYNQLGGKFSAIWKADM